MIPRVTVQTFGKRPNDVPCWDRRSDDVVLLAPLLRTAGWVYRSGLFCGQKTCCFFDFFFYPISLHTKPVLFSTFSRRRGALPFIPCIFLLGGPISWRTAATVVLHWAYKRNPKEFDPEIRALLIVAEKKIPEDNLPSNQKKSNTEVKSKKVSLGSTRLY